jgi:GR25 family glycosyltransferase involved in LPS biosynthesis
MTTIQSNNSFKTELCTAVKLPHSMGKQKLRLILDAKVKIAVVNTFTSLIEFFDKACHFLFRTKRKWAKISLADKPLLLNINSLVSRTLLNYESIISRSPNKLKDLLSNMTTVSNKPTKLNTIFPNILLINLKNRTDRIISLKDHLTKIGHSNLSYTRIDAIDKSQIQKKHFEAMKNDLLPTLMGEDHRAGRYACYLSHIKALEHARDQGMDHVLILEDDVRFKPKELSNGYLNAVFKELPSEWDFLFLGHFEMKSSKRVDHSEHLIRPGHPYDLHAYVVKRPMYNRLLAILKAEFTKEKMRPIDVVVAEEIAPHYEVFACKENVAIQDEGISTIRNKLFKSNYQNELKELDNTHFLVDRPTPLKRGKPAPAVKVANTVMTDFRPAPYKQFKGLPLFKEPPRDI